MLLSLEPLPTPHNFVPAVYGTPSLARSLFGTVAGMVRVEQREKNDLLEELMLLPENAVVRRINELVKRARSVKVHAYIIHYLRKQMPYMMGKQDKQVRSLLVGRCAREHVGMFYGNKRPVGAMEI